MNARTGMNRHIVPDKAQQPGQVDPSSAPTFEMK
jgi:hypothetical protein